MTTTPQDGSEVPSGAEGYTPQERDRVQVNAPGMPWDEATGTVVGPLEGDDWFVQFDGGFGLALDKSVLTRIETTA